MAKRTLGRAQLDQACDEVLASWALARHAVGTGGFPSRTNDSYRRSQFLAVVTQVVT